jgi:hypothetical protein
MNEPVTTLQAMKEKLKERIKGCSDTIKRESKFRDKDDATALKAQKRLNKAKESGNVSSIKQAQERLARAKFHQMRVYGGVNFILSVATGLREELERLERGAIS